jgi:hypothetical protein
VSTSRFRSRNEILVFPVGQSQTGEISSWSMRVVRIGLGSSFRSSV